MDSTENDLILRTKRNEKYMIRGYICIYVSIGNLVRFYVNIST